MNKIYLITICYPNYAHNRTETFYNENEASQMFDDLFKENDGKTYNAIYLNEIIIDKNQTWMVASWKRPQ